MSHLGFAPAGRRLSSALKMSKVGFLIGSRVGSRAGLNILTVRQPLGSRGIEEMPKGWRHWGFGVWGGGGGPMGIDRVLKGWRRWGLGLWRGSERLLRGEIGPGVSKGSQKGGRTGVQGSGGVVRGSRGLGE